MIKITNLKWYVNTNRSQGMVLCYINFKTNLQVFSQNYTEKTGIVPLSPHLEEDHQNNFSLNDNYPKPLNTLSREELSLYYECIDNINKLEAKYHEITIEAKEILSPSPMSRNDKGELDPNTSLISDILYLANYPTYNRVDLIMRPKESEAIERVSISSPEGSCDARRFLGDKEFILLGYDQNPNSALMFSFSQVLVDRAPYSTIQDISSYYNDCSHIPRQWELHNFHAYTENNEELVSFEPRHINGKNKGKVICYRNYLWAVKEYQFQEGGYNWHGKRQYDFIDGIPTLKWSEDWRGVNKNPQEHYIYEISNIKFGQVSLDKFNIEKVLGIKIGGTGANWTMRLILLGIGIALITVWVYFNRKAKKEGV